MSSPDPTPQSEWIREALEKHEASLIRYAQSLTGDPDLARDAVQDTFLRLCQQDRAEVAGHLAAWLFTVCRNRVLDVQRKERRMSPLSELDLETREAADPHPDAAAATADASGRLLVFLAELPPNQRDVVRLRFQAQMSYEEIAEVTALSVGNVGFLLHTAIKALRRCMDNLEKPNPARSIRPGTV